MKGLYLALVTIGAQFLIMYTILHWNSLTEGVTGMAIEPPQIGPLSFAGTTSFYYLAVGVAAIATYLTRNIIRTIFRTPIPRSTQSIGSKVHQHESLSSKLSARNHSGEKLSKRIKWS